MPVANKNVMRSKKSSSLTAKEVKDMARELGADLCGIAPQDRFADAPQGFHPRDVWPGCQSVAVLACRFLSSTLLADSTIPYTDVRNFVTRKMDQMAIDLSYRLEARGARALPINAIGPTEWDARTKKTRGIISLKHAGVMAGLGKIGENTLLINDRYGNMIWLSAVLISEELEADPLAAYEGCLAECTLCLNACPIQALDGVSMNQKHCWDYAFGVPARGGEWRIKCFACRRVCPHCLGIT